MELYFGNTTYGVTNTGVYESFNINEKAELSQNQESTLGQELQNSKKLPSKEELQKDANTVFANKELTQKYIDKINNIINKEQSNSPDINLNFEKAINNMGDSLSAVNNLTNIEK